MSKVAVEPVWNLEGMGRRFGISEELLRRSLFEGQYKALWSRIVVVLMKFRLSDVSCPDRNRWNVPRTPLPSRYQNLLAPHLRPNSLHLRSTLLPP